jgi:hypothetical protein
MIKWPAGWQIRDYWRERENKPVSATASIYEILAEVMEVELPDYYHKLSTRNYGGVEWVNETFDYRTMKEVGVAGYDDEYKWVLYFAFAENKVGKLKKISAYRLNESGLANDEEDVIKRIGEDKIKKAKEGAEEYLRLGAAFIEENPPLPQKKTRVTIN